ncbi:translation initiation factor 6 (aeIF-6) [Staphylothermus marinus F1]|uniref:Translation initiation factor 6 n=1 Tax=Staphylothermus marinus (strain ATCC 43588 / DSM 3639 / JCM 9404 / F1) TaxID=399550 RepID=IF6_STAMF|nr:translation initiation factor IF-6 [Staphylothermus marinus]A3DNH5.1 RecName: Full=Translation initiation factor 6; Short=aIF-6 [Staphylothermus marinus F1]ABN70185.1 translation initiation factor 6 (aeIF-6) [Staphylothermus marinus F1]
MEIVRLSLFGNPNIGVYVFANNSIALVPPSLSSGEKKVIAETLDVELVETKIANTILNGVLVVGNDNGIILPRIILDEELDILNNNLKKHDLNIYVSRSKNTALGNILLCNNKACIAGSELERQELNKISEALGVEALYKDIMNLTIPGSLAVVTDKGGVIHPDISDDENRELKEIFKVAFERATVNSGIPFIKSGLIANNKGIIVGEYTTGPEILRIRRGLSGGAI